MSKILRGDVAGYIALATSIAIVLGCGIGSAAGESPDAPSMLHERLTTVTTKIEQQTADPAASIGTRDLGNAALTTLIHGGDPAVAERMLDRGLEKQNLTEGATYGQIPWVTTDARITDLNAAPFFGLALGTILNGYSARLSPAYLVTLRPKLTALSQAIDHQPVPVTYTNIYLMRASDLIMLGQFLGDPTILSHGRYALRTWSELTRRVGISEFDSVWYYPPDLSALSQIERYATDAGDRRIARDALNLFWTDIAANYMPAAHKLSGPSSREYDFVTGNGDLPYWLEGVGWADADEVGHSNLGSIYIEDIVKNGGFKPSASIKALAFGPARDVTSTYDAYPGHTRWNWVGKNVSLGCAGGSYGPQDKLLTGTFAGPASEAQLNVLLQKGGPPYGTQSSTQKPSHLAPSLGCIERGGAAIATFFLTPALLGPTPRGFETDVIFPRDAALTVNGSPVSLAGGDVSLKLGDILAMRAGGGVIALRAVRVDNVAQAPTFTLTTDAKGSARGAAWLRIVHLQPGESPIPGSIMHESFIMVARDDGSLDAATAEIARANPQDVIGGGRWNVSASFPQGRYEESRSSTNRGSIDIGTINGAPPKRMTLGIDDRDVSSGL